MEISKEGINLIKKWESCKLKSYQCSAGVWTIGYGHTENVKQGDEITPEIAEEYLYQDLQARMVYLQDLKLNQNQFDACCSLIFNIGAGNFLNSQTREKIQDVPDDISVSFEWIEWVSAGGVRLRGLLLRRLDELKLYYKT